MHYGVEMADVKWVDDYLEEEEEEEDYEEDEGLV